MELLFTQNVDAVFNVAYRVLWRRADAEDVVQQTFLKVLLRLDQLQDSARVRPWLLQIAYREAISVLRSRRDLPTDPTKLPETEEPGAGPADLVVLSDVARTVQGALDAMDPDERLAVVLRDVEQLPMRDVAEVLGIGLSAAKMRVHRGRASLRLAMSGKGVW